MALFAANLELTAGVDEHRFATEVSRWIRGMRASTLLSDTEELSLGNEPTTVTASSGETILLQRATNNGTISAIGARHDLPDEDGRLWRTEAVLRFRADATPVLRVKTQCLAREVGTHLQKPRRPHLLRSLVAEQLAAPDGVLTPKAAPHWLGRDEDDILVAGSVVEGSASRALPVVWVSAIGSGTWALDRSEIEKLAKALAGVAHVVVEADRADSFRLMRLTDGKNAYGGTIGLSLPGEGFVRRFFIGWAIPDASALYQQVHDAALSASSTMPVGDGWEWSDLQEAALTAERHKLQESRDYQALLEMAEKERDALKEALDQTREDLRDSTRRLSAAQQEGGGLADRIGKEIWDGEFLDRLSALLQWVVDHRAADWDQRSLAVFRQAYAALPRSRGLNVLRQELDRAARDGKFEQFLLQYGFVYASHNNHIKLDPADEIHGLHTVTLANTPSDWRAAQNQKSQIEENLGLKRL